MPVVWAHSLTLTETFGRLLQRRAGRGNSSAVVHAAVRGARDTLRASIGVLWVSATPTAPRSSTCAARTSPHQPSLLPSRAQLSTTRTSSRSARLNLLISSKKVQDAPRRVSRGAGVPSARPRPVGSPAICCDVHPDLPAGGLRVHICTCGVVRAISALLCGPSAPLSVLGR